MIRALNDRDSDRQAGLKPRNQKHQKTFKACQSLVLFPSILLESVFASGEAQGWRAAEAETQTIRLVFDQPQRLKRISVVFEEKEVGRTQEFVLCCSADGGNSFREIVRQQWNFSPSETVREVQEYQIERSNVTVLEVIIVPNMSGGAARASLKSLRLS